MGTILQGPLLFHAISDFRNTKPDENELGKHPNSMGSPRCTKYFRASHVRVICTCIPCPLRSPKPLTSEASAWRARRSSSPALTHRRNASLQHHVHGPERCRLSKCILCRPQKSRLLPSSLLQRRDSMASTSRERGPSCKRSRTLHSQFPVLFTLPNSSLWWTRVQ